MTEVFALYLFTRLDAIGSLLRLIAIFGAIALFAAGAAALLTAVSMSKTEEKFHLAAKQMLRPIAVVIATCAVLNVLIPTKNDAIFIVAGTGVIEAAKSDRVQQMAGKAASVIEKAMDDYLQEGGKK